MIRLPLILLLPLIIGCATVPAKMNATFNESDFIPYAQSGTANITGSVFLKTIGGDVKLGAGNEVMLSPITPYVRERLERVTIRREKLEEPDQRWFQKYVRRTLADATGNFEFKNLPAGEYVIYCDIFWSYGAGTSMQTTGDTAFATVTVKSGETSKVVVTRNF